MKRIFSYACGCLLVLGLSGCGDKPAPSSAETPVIPVRTASVIRRDVPLFFEMIGTIKPASTVVIKPQVNGLIKKIYFTEGEHVEEGALLYTIEEAPYAIRVKEIEAQRDQNLVHLNTARKKLERFHSITKQDVIAKVEWDELEAKIALYQAMLNGDEARLSAARLDLEHCKVKAPATGYMGKSLLSAGNRVSSGEALVTLTQKDPLTVDFSLAEKELSSITTTSPLIEISFSGSDAVLASGHVTFMDHAIDPKTGMLAASARLTKKNQLLWPGQTVRVKLYYGKKENALLVPLRAIRTNQNGPYLYWVKEDNTVELCPVQLGLEEKGDIVIEQGVEVDKKVVVEGHLRLFPGSKVEDVLQ